MSADCLRETLLPFAIFQSSVKHRMIAELSTIMKFYSILESRFSKVRQFSPKFLRFYTYLWVSQ